MLNMDTKTDTTTNKQRTLETKHIPMKDYRDWYDVLIVGDERKVQSILQEISLGDRFNLVNLPFDYQDTHLTVMLKKQKQQRLYLPLHIALTACSKEVVTLLMENGADIFAVDYNSFNILHACVFIAFMKPDIEYTICDTLHWFLENRSLQDIKVLLEHENSQGYRPIEFAAQQGCLKIFRTLMENGTFLTHVENCGDIDYKFYDVSEYEIGDRQSKSPINMLPFVDNRKLMDPEFEQDALNPLFTKWMDAKIKSNVIPMAVWIMLRTFFVICYYILDLDISTYYELYGANITESLLCPDLSWINLESQTSKITVMAMAISYLILTLSMDAIEFIQSLSNKSCMKVFDMKGRKKVIANTNFYIGTNTFLQLAYFSCFVMYFLYSMKLMQFNEDTVIIYGVIRALVPISLLWTIIYFFQFLPKVGLSIISIQQMYIDLTRFGFLAVMFIFPFIHTFQVYVMNNSLTGCHEDFSTPYKTFYTLFLMMLNEYDIGHLDVKNIGIFQILHIMFIFNITILLLNFLIAMMTTKAGTVRTNKNVMLKLNQFAIAVRIEDRMFTLTKHFYKMFRTCGFHCEESKVFVILESNRLDSLLEKKKHTRRSQYMLNV